jgi:hypothetical protein
MTNGAKLNLDEIHRLARIVAELELTSITVGEVRIVKRLHRVEPPKQRSEPVNTQEPELDEAVLFASSREPRMTVEDMPSVLQQALRDTEPEY